jgi:hypothetical protein
MGRGKSWLGARKLHPAELFPRPLEIPQTTLDFHIPSATAATIYRFSSRTKTSTRAPKSVNYVPGIKCQLCPRSHMLSTEPRMFDL